MEHFVNSYAVREGTGGGLGGKSYEVLATRKDLGLLASELLKSLEEYDSGELRILKLAQKHEVPMSKEGEVLVLSKYVTQTGVRTDRVALQFFAAPTLEPYHRQLGNAKSLDIFTKVFGLLWFGLLPALGIFAVVKWLLSAVSP